MTARISLIPGRTRGHRPRLQCLAHEFCNSLSLGGDWGQTTPATINNVANAHVGAVYDRAFFDSSLLLTPSESMPFRHAARRPICCFAAVTISRGSNPNFFWSSLRGADA